jgi:hypothetical protein
LPGRKHAQSYRPAKRASTWSTTACCAIAGGSRRSTTLVRCAGSFMCARAAVATAGPLPRVTSPNLPRRAPTAAPSQTLGPGHIESGRTAARSGGRQGRWLGFGGWWGFLSLPSAASPPFSVASSRANFFFFFSSPLVARVGWGLGLGGWEIGNYRRLGEEEEARRKAKRSHRKKGKWVGIQRRRQKI